MSFSCDGSPPGAQGFFKLDDDTICYGYCSSGLVKPSVGNDLYVVGDGINCTERAPHLPFDPDQLVDNLLLEQYPVKVPLSPCRVFCDRPTTECDPCYR